MIPGLSLFPGPDETIEGVGRMLRSGETTCEAVVECCLSRIDQWDGQVRAWVHVDRDGARKQARDLDRELAEGKDRGPLHGIPVGVKDIIDVAGLPTSAGARTWSDGPAPEDAGAVALLRSAGVVILGKTVTTPYAWVDPPETRNPWGLDRTPGGSSSGSAAALAVGMCLGALGTQTGGSLTRPAAFCGVASFKPTDGDLFSRGIIPLSPSLDTLGILARTVADLRVFWKEMMEAECPGASGGRPESLIMARAFRMFILSDSARRGFYYSSPTTIPDPKPLAFNPGLPPVLGRVRGFFDDLIDSSARVTHEAAVVDLVAAGATVVDVDLPDAFYDIHRPHRLVVAAEASAFHAPRATRMPKDYPPRILALIEEGRSISACDYLQALDLRRSLWDAIDWAVSSVHALVVPAALGTAPGAETTGDPSFNSPWNFAQLPTVSFPIGLSGDGLPLAMQVVGHRFDQPFDVALWCEQVIRRSRS